MSVAYFKSDAYMPIYKSPPATIIVASIKNYVLWTPVHKP